LVGDVDGFVDKTLVPQSDILYPYRFTDFKEKFSINQFAWRAILWKLQIKGNARYHTEITTGKSTAAHKYSEDLMNKIKSLLSRYPDWVKQTTEEYKTNQ
jgi:hypothetical protein